MAVGPPHAGLDNLTKAGVRCVKEVVVVEVRVSGGGGGGMFTVYCSSRPPGQLDMSYGVVLVQV